MDVGDAEFVEEGLRDDGGAASQRIDLAIEQALRLLPPPARLALAA